MKEKDLNKITLELRRKLFDTMKDFWEKNKEINMEQVFFINSMVISSLIAQISHNLFKKDINNNVIYDYIDEICNISKKQLELSKDKMKKGMN